MSALRPGMHACGAHHQEVQSVGTVACPRPEHGSRHQQRERKDRQHVNQGCCACVRLPGDACRCPADAMSEGAHAGVRPEHALLPGANVLTGSTTLLSGMGARPEVLAGGPGGTAAGPPVRLVLSSAVPFSAAQAFGRALATSSHSWSPWRASCDSRSSSSDFIASLLSWREH